MRTFRRRLTPLAVLALSGHLASVVLGPAAFCCEPPPAAAGLAEEDCCPAGTHPGAVCPMRGRTSQAQRAVADSPDTDCRIGASEESGATLLLGAAGPLPQPPSLPTMSSALRLEIVSIDSLCDSLIIPPSPPPRV